MPGRAFLLVLALVIAGCERGAHSPTQQLETPSLTVELYCVGEGSPAVILLPGLQGKSSRWHQVLRGLQDESNVCAVDFVIKDEPVSGSEIADAVYEALQRHDSSYAKVLVAHSFGGYLARLLYPRLGEVVVGIVLLESSHPDMLAAYKPLVGEKSYTVMQEFVRSQPNNIDLVQTEAAVRKAADFGTVPLVIVSRGKPGSIEGLSTEENENVDRAWAGLQRELLALSSNSRQVIAESSGHNVPFDEPGAVIDVVGNLVNLK